MTKKEFDWWKSIVGSSCFFTQDVITVLSGKGQHHAYFQRISAHQCSLQWGRLYRKRYLSTSPRHSRELLLLTLVMGHGPF